MLDSAYMKYNALSDSAMGLCFLGALALFTAASPWWPSLPKLEQGTSSIRVNYHMHTQTDTDVVVGRWIVEARTFEEAIFFVTDNEPFPMRASLDALGGLRVDDLSSITETGAVARWWTAVPHTEWSR